MAKSKSGTASPENSIHSESNGEGKYPDAASRNNGAGLANTADLGNLVEQAKTWVEENQTSAMLSGFGFGVFIGVLLRR